MKVLGTAMFGPRVFYSVGKAWGEHFWFAWTRQVPTWADIVSLGRKTAVERDGEGVVFGDLAQTINTLHAVMGALALSFEDSEEPDVVAQVGDMCSQLLRDLTTQNNLV